MGWRWSKEEIDFLKENYGIMQIDEVSEKLNRSISTIRAVAWKMGCVKSFNRKCEYCGKEFTTRIQNKKFCCAECRKEIEKIKQYKNYKKYKERAEKRKQRAREKS